MNSVIQEIELREYGRPIYVDTDHSFREKNSFIPDDEIFHTFLTDSEGIPVFVGDPLGGMKLYDLFINRIKGL